MKRIYRYGMSLILTGVLLTSCITISTGGDTDNANTNVTAVVLNQAQAQNTPTSEAQPAARQQPAQEQQPQEPTNTPLPCNKAKFIAENIADNTEFAPGETFTKTWTMRNDGTCTWDSSYRVVFNEGDRMNGESSYNLNTTVKPGETVDLSVHLTAPDTPGTYKGYWNIKAPDSDLFTFFYTQIKVVDNTPPFAVTGVSTNLSSSYNPGACPYALNLVIYITANGAGTVTYRPETSDLGMQGSRTLTFNSAGTLTDSYTWTFTYSSPYWIKIHVDSPNHQTFGPYNFNVTCP